MKRPIVAVLAGGPDAEREVSIMSGRAVAEALGEHGGFDIRYHEIDTLAPHELRAIKADVFFPALHGPWGEGGPLQRLLEEDGRSFVGSGSAAAELAMDKMTTKAVATEIGVPTPSACILCSPDDRCTVEPPLVLKPIDDGSSVDVFICRTDEDVARHRADLHRRRDRFMAERFIPGRELTVGIVGDEVDSLIEIVPLVEFYDYEAKYTREDTRYVVDPPLPPGTAEQITADAMRLFRALDCRDLARVDFRLESGASSAWMLEINTMPGFTSHSLVPMGAVARGRPMPRLCADLVNRALARTISNPA